MREIISELNDLRGRSRLFLVLQRSAVIVAWVLIVLLALGGLDFLVRFPKGFRLVLLLAGLGTLGWMLWKWIWPAVRFAPTLTDMALRVEQVIPSLQGRLASSVEFAHDASFSENAMAARSMREAQSRVAGVDVNEVVNTKRTKRDVGMLLGMLALVVLLLILSPAAAGTGLKRLLLPLGNAKWPARTGIASLMEDVAVHARGQALPLRAKGTRAPGNNLDSLSIVANYRFRQESGYSGWKEITLAPQGDAEYESLIDTDANAIEFFFESEDDATSRQTIQLTPPPAIESATLSINPPSYAQPYQGETTLDLGPGLDERAITETPSLIGSVVTLTLQLNKAIPVPQEQPQQSQWIFETFGWQDSANLPDMQATQPSADELTLSWTLQESTSLTLRLVDEFGLENTEDIAYRIDAVEDRLPSVTIVEPESDQAVLPTAIVPLTADARDDVAMETLAIKARKQTPKSNDAGNATGAEGPVLWKRETQVDSPNGTLADSIALDQLELAEGDVIEVRALAQDIYDLNSQTHDPAVSAVRRLRIISERELGETLFQELKALRQNAIRLETQQADLQDDVIDNGVQPGIQRGQQRIGERLREQIEALQRLAERKEMNQFSDNQLDTLIDQAEDLLTHAGQASNEATSAIEQRPTTSPNDTEDNASENSADINGDNDSQLNETDGQPEAGENANSNDSNNTADNNAANNNQSETDNNTQGDSESQPNANEQNQNNADEQSQNDNTQETEDLELREPAEEDKPIVEAQQEVRDELRDLIESLDRNEDTWVMNQRLKDLLDQQTQLQSETQTLSNQTMGRDMNELEPAELTELDRIRQQQQELAEGMRELVDDLRDRAEDMEEVDPQAAGAQRQAADTAEQQGTDRKMDAAAQQTSQNQLQNAQNSQQQARQDLEQMIEDLDQKRAQAEELQRRLESLIESIERLITVQRSEITALVDAKASGNFAGRDRAMIRLNQNTQAVSGEARSAGQETARIARALDRAADAQGAAVGYLRAKPIAADDADGAEQRSLELLEEAASLAEELEEQVEEDLIQQRRAELMQAYSDLQERQLALRGETLDLQELEQLDRRALVDARRQGSIQEEIRTALEDVLAEATEVSDSIVFSHVHQMMNDWSLQVADNLKEGDVSVDTTDRQRSIAEALGRLTKALEEEQNQQDEFEEGNQGGSGGSGSGGEQPPQPLVPPIAELKLLRGMQEQIYDSTRDLDSRDDLETASRRQRMRELGRHQNDLIELGQQMLDQLAQQGAGMPSGGNNDSTGDAESPGETPNIREGSDNE